LKQIFVGNLPFSATEDEIRQIFEEFGTVYALRLIEDKDSGQKKGFGFVHMYEEDAVVAIAALEGAEIGGRFIHVHEAKNKK
jgi:RNA recognition motif-containing protein